MAELPEGLPATIKIGYKDFAIIAWAVVEAMDANRYGETAHQAGVIRIDFSHGLHKSAHTLLHEIMHACSAFMGLVDEDKEERYVTALSNALATAWRDNPDVFAWLDRNLAA